MGCGPIARAQQFEVASVKPSDMSAVSEGQIRAQDMVATMTPPGFLPLKGASVSIRLRTLAQLVSMAYKVPVVNVIGPKWISEARFDIEAKLPEGAPSKDANAMLQKLLEERFALKTHSETKTAGGYALVVAKDGPKLGPAIEQGEPFDKEEMQRRARERMEKRMEEMRKSGGSRGGYSTWHADSASTATIAENVGRMIKAPVVDETKLTGKYEANIELGPGESPDEPIEYRMSQALAKLGLKIEARKTPVQTLVVDSVLKTPTEN